jgi:hypothetical protein
MAERLRGWANAKRPKAFGAVALLGPSATPHEERIALDALASVTALWRDGSVTAAPPPRHRVVVWVSRSLGWSAEFGKKIVGPAPEAGLELGPETGLPHAAEVRERIANLSDSRSRLQTVRGLRLALKDRYLFTLPAVDLADMPDDAGLGQGLCVVVLGSRRWFVPLAQGLPLAEAAAALVGALEAAVVPEMHRLAGIDDASALVGTPPPGLAPPVRPERALATLRALLAERIPVGDHVVAAAVRDRLKAGDPPDAIVSHVRGLPGLQPLLWGNEPHRVRVLLPREIASRLAAGLAPDREDLGEVSRLVAGRSAPVLVVATAGARAKVRAALATAFPDLPVLAASECARHG